MAKRRDRVAPPPKGGRWDFRFASNDAAKGWGQLCVAAANNTRTAWERLPAEPRQRDHRQHPFKGALGERSVNGKNLDQWQYEGTGAGRIWYCSMTTPGPSG